MSISLSRVNMIKLHFKTCNTKIPAKLTVSTYISPPFPDLDSNSEKRILTYCDFENSSSFKYYGGV